MKKIVGIIAAVAMAASVFAVDISAALRMKADLFNVDFADGAKPAIFSLDNPNKTNNRAWSQGGITFSVSTEKAGASFNIDNFYETWSGKNRDYSWRDFAIWMKPIDMLTIKLGGVDYNINKEQIDWSGSLNSTSADGFAFDLAPIDGLTVSLVLTPGYDTPWITFGDSVKGTAFYAKYSADFGTIGFAWIYSGSADYKFNGIGLTVPDYNKFSLGYSNTFGDVFMFADAAFGIIGDSDVVKALDTAAFDLSVDAFVKYNKDSFGIAGYLCYTNNLLIGHLNNKYNAGLDFGVYNDLSILTKLTYQLDSVGIYLYAKVADVMLADGDDLNIEIKPGVTFNIGAASCDIALDFTNIGGNPVNLAVPFIVSIGF